MEDAALRNNVRGTQVRKYDFQSTDSTGPGGPSCAADLLAGNQDS